MAADKILLEGDNISLLNAHMLKSSGNGNITLRADNKVTVGYEVTDKTTINVGDDAPGGHTVSDYRLAPVLKAVLFWLELLCRICAVTVKI